MLFFMFVCLNQGDYDEQYIYTRAKWGIRTRNGLDMVIGNCFRRLYVGEKIMFKYISQ
jgi:hypothetical protein